MLSLFGSEIEREGKIVASIDHPNVVKLLGRGEHDGRLYLAMELLHGENLGQVIQRAGPLPLARAMAGALQLASALGELHRHGVVHRDVNSANVMVEEGDRFVLLDFGLARGAESSKLTRADTVMGTLSYMSPEQLRGEELDERTDWWSLGVVIHEMVTGDLPWEGETTIQVAMSILGASGKPSRRESEKKCGNRSGGIRNGAWENRRVFR